MVMRRRAGEGPWRAPNASDSATCNTATGARPRPGTTTIDDGHLIGAPTPAGTAGSMTTDLVDLPALAPATVAATWCDRERRYQEGRYDGAGAVDAVGQVTGWLPVLLSAGHAVTHFRHGAPKRADIGTGGLAELLAERVGAHAITSTGIAMTDPNYDPHGTFKDHLLDLACRVEAVVDLHGMTDGYGPDVCLGSGALPALADGLIVVFRAELEVAGFFVTVDDPFLADRPTTVTSTAQAAGVPALQLEIARRVRNPWQDPETAARLVGALGRAVAAAAGLGDRVDAAQLVTCSRLAG